MEIGQHMLEGEVVKLANPFLITSKRDPDNAQDPDLSVIGLIYKKIIFKTRPKPKGISKL